MYDSEDFGPRQAAEFVETLERAERCDHDGEQDVVGGLVFCAGCRTLLFTRR